MPQKSPSYAHVKDPTANKNVACFTNTPPQSQDDDSSVSTAPKTLSLESILDSLPSVQVDPPRRTQSHSFEPPPIVTVNNPTVQRALNKLATSPSYRVTGDTTARPIFPSNDDASSIVVIYSISALGGEEK